jgi:hypothetical protein
MRPIFAILALAPFLLSQPVSRPFQPPDDIAYRTDNIYSEGTRMAAEVFAPTSADSAKLPTILMAHGWGGTAALLRPDAVVFARSGYLVVTFDYRGWGASDSRVILTGPAPATRQDHRFTTEVKEVREVVDPLDMATDWLNALHWLHGEPQCDTSRIGLWGSSFSGGLVVYAAARDPRVKALHSQVGSLEGAALTDGVEMARTYEEATRRARNEIGYPPPGAKAIGNLRGAPIRARFIDYAPVNDVNRAPHVAMQFVIAEKEELFDNRDHAIKAYEQFRGTKKLVNIPKITHYGIYVEARKQAQQLAVDWFDKHLKK